MRSSFAYRTFMLAHNVHTDRLAFALITNTHDPRYEKHKSMLPTPEDVMGIRDGMLRAQRTYDMSVERMTRGNTTFVEVLRMAQHAAGQHVRVSCAHSSV